MTFATRQVALLLLVACSSTSATLITGEFSKTAGMTEEAAVEQPTESVTPVQKVVTLLENLQAEVQAEGSNEAASYDAYACFCKDTTLSKSTAIKEGQDNIESLSATMEEKTAEKAEKASELAQRKKQAEELAATLQSTEVQFAKDKAEYEATSADLDKAISSLNSAIEAMEASKPAAEAQSLLQVSDNLSEVLAIADAMGLVAEDSRPMKLGAFLQEAKAGRVDPNDPEYKFHSQGIIDVLNELLGDFTKNKAEVDAEFEKTRTTYESTVQDLNTQISDNDAAMKQLAEDIENLTAEIAQARLDLLNADAQMKDDELYLKDLTAQCEARAKDWDQRSQMRRGELEALGKALEILTGRVQVADENVNFRALLQAKPIKAHVSLLQEDLEKHTASHRHSLRLTSQAKRKAAQQRAIALLTQTGKRLGSTVLSSVAMHVAADPFAKVNKLIQALIERLLREATEEATKKGFCDTELGKAEKDRDYRFEEANKLSVEIAQLEAKRDTLKEELGELDTALGNLNLSLNATTQMRAQEKEDNLATIKEAQEGLEAVTEALVILKAFYKQAAKGGSVLLQASPVDEDTSGPGFDTVYKGKQESSQSIIGLLEVIKSDFERTVRVTKEMEKTNAADFVLFDRTTKSDIGGKDTKEKLNTDDLATTEATLEQKFTDLKTAMNLLDAALKTLEDLKPTCTDSGMTYAERVAKREEEMEALKSALCILDTDGVEPDCAASA